MKIAFRLECPFCKWGHEWRDEYVNMGWVSLICFHCGKKFYSKISIPSIDVSIEQFLPSGVPCQATPEVKNAGLDDV